jgi:hypothetical protein
MKYLKDAVRINPEFEEYVKTDPDFDDVRDEPVYQRTVENLTG